MLIFIFNILESRKIFYHYSYLVPTNPFAGKRVLIFNFIYVNAVCWNSLHILGNTAYEP